MHDLVCYVSKLGITKNKTVKKNKFFRKLIT